MKRIIAAITGAVLLSLTGSLITAGPASAAWVKVSRHKTKAICEGRASTIYDNGASMYSVHKCVFVPISPTRPWTLYMD
ncbi:hypothetical protein ACFVMC_28790 [Nocardia sp. NPDC127579]|uniref:hypothetical protein n=1 Tax=Nocardia sp. NPDC127579 TaxID=3345402 RepID=UPI003625BCD8